MNRMLFLPLAAVVVFLSRAIPLEGGMYQWLKEGFSPFAGYMAGWNYSIFFMRMTEPRSPIASLAPSGRPGRG